MSFLLGVPLLLLACTQGEELWGMEHQIKLNSSLDFTDGIYSRLWGPATPVAVGTEFTLDSVGWVDSSGVQHDYGANAVPSLDESSAFSSLETDLDQVRLQATSVGAGTVSWVGDADDEIALSASTPVSLALRDPIGIALAMSLDAGMTLLAGDPPEQLFHSVRVLGDQTVGLWPELSDETGETLAFDGDQLLVDGPAYAVGSALFVGGGEGQIETTYAGTQPVSGVEVTQADEADVSSLELIVVDLADYRGTWGADLAVLLVALDGDGARLWQPDVRWSLPPEFLQVYPSMGPEILGQVSVRTDVILLAWDRVTDATSFEIGAQVGSIANSTRVAWGSGTPPPNDDSDPLTEESGVCACSPASDSPSGLLLPILSLLGCLRRRRQRREYPHKSATLGFLPRISQRLKPWGS